MPAYTKKLMAALCQACREPATQEVFDKNGASKGKFCDADAAAKVRELDSGEGAQDARQSRERRG